MVHLRYLFDEHLRGVVSVAVRRYSLRRAFPLDIVEVGDPPDLSIGTPDPQVLLWAEANGRVLVTRDRTTIPTHLQHHLAAGHHLPGLFLLRQVSLSLIAEYLVLAAYTGDQAEWQDHVVWIP